MANGNTTPSSSFLDVCLALKSNIMRDLHVAEIGKVTATSSDFTSFTVVPINDSNTKIKCIKLRDLTIATNDIVLVVFTDTNADINLKRINNNNEPQNIELKGQHNINSGVIVGII